VLHAFKSPAAQSNHPSHAAQPRHFIHGLDLRLYERHKYEKIEQRYRESLGGLGIELIPARTNGFLFWQYRTRWEWVYTPILMGAALCLGGLLRRFYVGASEQYADLYTASSHPITDHLFSTETLEIIHHGCRARRIEKLEAVSRWPVTYDLLRLCTNIDRRQGVENCCTCYKCMRARSMLAVIGSLEKFTTFPKPYSTLEILRLALDTHAAPNIPRQIFGYAIRARRWRFVLPALVTFLIDSVKQVLRPRVVALVPNPWIFRWKARRYRRFAEKPETGLEA
jgi:hypothetical protein